MTDDLLLLAVLLALLMIGFLLGYVEGKAAGRMKAEQSFRELGASLNRQATPVAGSGMPRVRSRP